MDYPGAIHHVMNRGDRREKIFLDDVDRQDFRKTLAEACQKTGWPVHAHCLMSNHLHWVVETPEANLGEYGFPQDTPEGRAQFSGCLEKRRWEESDEETLASLETRWCWGRQEFREKRLERVEGIAGDHLNDQRNCRSGALGHFQKR
jgi:hypothetical protein